MVTWFAFAECLRRLRWTLPLAALLAAAVVYGWPSLSGMGSDAQGTASLALHVPAFLVTAGTLTAVLEAWPLFARGRPGADYLVRLAPGPLGGCAAASAGALAALSLGLAAAGALFAGLLIVSGFTPPPLYTHYALSAEQTFLDAENPELHVTGPGDAILAAIELWPRSVVRRGGAFETTAVQVLADGEAIHDGWLELGGQLEPYRLSFDPRPIRRLVIRRAEGPSPPLLFGDDALHAVGATSQSWVLGCVLGALSYLFPAALALALACLARQRLALPIVVVAVLAVLATSTLTDLMPNAGAVTDLSRGRWFPGEKLLRQIAPSLSAATVVIMIAMATGRRHR